jgi:coenzyme F420-0:L-glutamate ligase/coenzyme F420-1:gamma-L-glutamate ligase
LPGIQIIGIQNIPLIEPNDDIAQIICTAAANQNTPLHNKDILVITQKIISKSEGRIVKLNTVQVSPFAQHVSKITEKDPRIIELILREAKSLVRMIGHHLITETQQGWICANSGLDQSNVSGGDAVTLLPQDSDQSAQRIRQQIRKYTGKDVAVLISDTFGRPFRLGHTDICIGIAGLSPLLDLRGQLDLFGYQMRVKRTAIGDELASAAELVIGNCQEQIPAAIIRGYTYTTDNFAKAIDAIMPRESNLFM